MTFLSGVSFDEVWTSREHGDLDGLNVPFISKEMLQRNKAASGRLQDLADLEITCELWTVTNCHQSTTKTYNL